jgi:hypothetical protein
MNAMLNDDDIGAPARCRGPDFGAQKRGFAA